MTCVIACSKLWRPNIATLVESQTGERCILVQTPQELDARVLADLEPRLIFFPHWSHHISPDMFERWECVIFHMTDLPFGRGGSPLQNLIERGIYETRITALRCYAELDSGPVYMKAPLSLHGSAQEIYLRATDAIGQMIIQIITRTIVPVPQVGEPVVFRRRKREDGNVEKLTSLQQLHDWIRMLDADGYPPAYLELGAWRFEFSRSSLRGDDIVADVRICRRSNDY